MTDLLAARTQMAVSLGFHNAAAPESTLKYLLIALGVGSGLIFPALIYLIKSLKLR